MSVSVTVPPTNWPVALEDARDHLRIVGTAQDKEILRKLDMATRLAEARTARGLITQTVVCYRHTFPGNDDGRIELPIGPVQSVTSIKYYDTAGVLRTLSASVYESDLIGEPHVIRPAYGQSWPDTYDKLNAIQITLVVGYGDAPDDVPTPIQEAVLLMLGDAFENRTASVERGQPIGDVTVDALLTPYTIWWVGDDEGDTP